MADTLVIRMLRSLAPLTPKLGNGRSIGVPPQQSVEQFRLGALEDPSAWAGPKREVISPAPPAPNFPPWHADTLERCSGALHSHANADTRALDFAVLRSSGRAVHRRPMEAARKFSEAANSQGSAT